MKCGVCGAGIGLVSGKGKGYYGCMAAARCACKNRVRVPRPLAEDVILRSVEDRFADAEVIRRVLLTVERRLGSLSREVPDALRAKRLDLRREERRQANLVAFAADGRGTKAGGGGGSRTRVREYVPTGLYMLIRACCFAPGVRARPKPPAAERRKISLRPVVAPGRSQPAG